MTPSLGQRIVQLRAKRNWTQEELAAASGVSRSRLAVIETDKGGPPQETTLAKLAKALEVTVPELRGTATPSPIQSSNPDVVTALLNQLAEQAEQHRRALKEQRKADLITMRAQGEQWQYAFDEMAKQRDEWKGKAEWYEVLLNMRVPTQEQDLQLQKMRHNTPAEVKPVQVKGLKNYEPQHPQGEEVEMCVSYSDPSFTRLPEASNDSPLKLAA